MKILLVDDALDMRLVMKRTLLLMGHDVTLAEDGEAAWERLQHESFQVVITDWVMPRMDGPALCRRIRQTQFPNYIYIIMLTGMSGKLNLIAGMDAGADDFANKPVERVEMDVLLRAAERVISLEKRLEQQNRSLSETNDRLREAQDIIQRDLRHAAALQTGILPTQKQLGPLNIAWFFRPASFIGGDTFNFLPLGNDCYLFYTVDVSGHGISSALLSMYLANLLSTSAEQLELPCTHTGREALKEEMSRLVGKFNTHLLTMLDFSDHYFTMLLGVIDVQAQQVHLVQAGHPKPFVVDTRQQLVKELDYTGFPVGLVPGVDFETYTHPFGPGQRLAVFSDGLFEMRDSDGLPLDEKRLAAALQDSAGLSVEAAMQAICHLWLGQQDVPADQPDDLSLLIVDFCDLSNLYLDQL